MRRFKLNFGFGLGKGVPVFSPTHLMIFLLHADWQAEIKKIPDSKYWLIRWWKIKMIRRVGANHLPKPNSKLSLKRLIRDCHPIVQASISGMVRYPKMSRHYLTFWGDPPVTSLWSCYKITVTKTLNNNN